MQDIISSSLQQNNSYTTDVNRLTTRNVNSFSQLDINKARQIVLKKNSKALLILVGKILESSDWCRASRPKLAYMLSEKTSKTLCTRQISRITGQLEGLKLITEDQTTNKGTLSYNE